MRAVVPKSTYRQTISPNICTVQQQEYHKDYSQFSKRDWFSEKTWLVKFKEGKLIFSLKVFKENYPQYLNNQIDSKPKPKINSIQVNTTQACLWSWFSIFFFPLWTFLFLLFPFLLLNLQKNFFRENFLMKEKWKKLVVLTRLS